MRLVLCLLMVATGGALGATQLEELRAASPPVFRPGHTLPPLTRWGWALPYELRVELCERWGYALEFGGYVTEQVAARLNDPTSLEAKLCALTASDPQRYPLCVLTIHGAFGDLPDEAWTHDAAGQLPDGKRFWSPEAPVRLFEEAGRRWAEPLRQVRAKAPIAIVLNGGEYATSVYGHHGKYWEQDPRITAARGDRSWFDYVSAAKARQELPISEAFRAAVPDRQLYLYYHTSGSPDHDRYGGWWTWCWDYQAMRRVSDVPNSSIYYRHFNSGFTGAQDMLSQQLNAVARQIAVGDPLSYNWLSAGWVRPNLGEQAFADRERYLGYLKCCYTAGMVGGVAGYFSVPKPEDPQWLWQIMALGHCHALFSHLEDFLRRGELLPGPDRHRWSKDLPAHEFPTGDATARVLARRHRDRPEWLLCAWAADGLARDVTATVPDLGEVALMARPAGSVYRAVVRDGRPVLTLVDQHATQPTKGMAER